jgi:SP family galactose:H+ symporter-like MFS transporter
LVSYVVSTVAQFLPAGTWRYQLGGAALPAVLQLALHRNLQESPPWLLSKDRRDDAVASLSALFPKASPGLVVIELGNLEACASCSPVGLRMLFVRHRRAVALGLGVNVLQQVSGINVVIYFGPQILKYAGFNNSASMVLTALVSVIQLVATRGLIGTVDRIGRRPLAKLGIVLMAAGLSLIIVAFCWATEVGHSTRPGGWIAVAGMLLFRAAFSLSLGPLPYIMTSEFFPQEARASGVALSWTTNWAANFAVSLTFPIAVGSSAGPARVAGVFSVYVCFSVLAFAFVQRWLPETAGLRLEAASVGQCLPAPGSCSSSLRQVSATE